MLHYDLGIDALGLGQPSPTLDACSTKTEILARRAQGAGSPATGLGVGVRPGCVSLGTAAVAPPGTVYSF